MAVSDLPACKPLLGTFNAMIERIAYQVQQWFKQTIDDGFIRLSRFAVGDQRNLLVEPLRHVAHEPWKRTKT